MPYCAFWSIKNGLILIIFVKFVNTGKQIIVFFRQIFFRISTYNLRLSAQYATQAKCIGRTQQIIQQLYIVMQWTWMQIYTICRK